MPRRIPIRIKLAAALAVPIVALLAVAALEVSESASNATETAEQTELATRSEGPGGIIVALQNERNVGSVWILGSEDILELPEPDFASAEASTDRAIENFRADIEASGGAIAERFAPALEGLEPALAELRPVVENFEGERSTDNQDISTPFFDGYTELINALFEATGQVPLALDDPMLRRGVELGDLATHQIENLALLSRTLLLAGVSPGGLNEPTEISEAAALLGQVETTLDSIHSLGVAEYGDATARVEQRFAESRAVELAHEAIDTGTVDINGWLASLSRERGEGFDGYRSDVYEMVTDRADELEAEASARRLRYLAFGVAALLVAGFATWLVSRSITRPLRSLTRQAKEMADHRLPEAVTDILETPLGEDVTVPQVAPVHVNTRDEVADVAEALNTVQDSALDLAVEQAVLRRNIADSFVNLGRRNQNLLGRQLDFITELETNETDPDALANLFRLDHLATRMRRNAESLLVLAGIEPPRQWAAPVRLTDVIRAALGEVEDYQRVTVRGVEPATIVGSAAADLAHLLAELIENALVFSPPDQTVDIRGRTRPGRADTGGAAGYTLAIIDSGLGMPAGDVAAANRRLAGAESFTIAPSKYLGHYVAGNLAARHGIHVHLDNSPGNGITATVDLPPSLLTADADLAPPMSPPHGTPAIGARGPAGALGRAPAGAGFGPGNGGFGGPNQAGMFGSPAGAGFGAPAPATEGFRGGQPGGHRGGRRGPGAPAGPGGAPADPRWDAPDGVPPAPVLDPTAQGGMPMPAPRREPVSSRTASGLVKRTPRGGEQAPAAQVPDADLLASLSDFTNNLGTRSPHVPPPSSHTAPPPPRGDTPWAPVDRGPDGGRSWPAPPGAVPGGAVPGGAVPGGPTYAPGETTGERPALPSRRGEAAPPEVRGHDNGGATASGLTRRVRGAQLPATQPLNVRRRQVPPSDGPGGYRLGDQSNADGHMLGNGNTRGANAGGPAVSATTGPPASAPGNGHGAGRDARESDAAKNVYGFLTSFTQGVQRGLEEARRDQNTPKENP